MADVFLPKGTRDLLPAQMNLRLKIIDRVRSVFARYGFEPLETPAFERIETLMGKYGDEGDRLIFKILKRGEGGTRGEVDSALRYDLTVPLARVVAMNSNLPMPFKRSQIQPVWRADRPQKGRFREFWQCDVDIVGTESRLAEAECIAVANDVFTTLGFSEFTLRLNHRGILRAMAGAVDASEQEGTILGSIDKLDKVGRDGVARELVSKGLSESQTHRIFEMLDGAEIPGTADYEAELQQVMEYAGMLGVPDGRVKIDRSLARGLDYYTGPVWEIEVTEPKIGSLGGGGRYDELIGMFSGRPIPAVGGSIGIERVFIVMEELDMLPKTTTATRVWITVFSEETLPASLGAANVFRSAGIPVQTSMRIGKLGKQLRAADTRGVPFALVIGPDEIDDKVVTLKDLRTGEQWREAAHKAVLRVADASS